MAQRSRRRRVEDKRELLEKWAEEEEVSVTVLLGYLIYLDNWNGGQRSLASLGWKMFQEEAVMGMPVASLEEATWLMERSGMSQAVYLEMRLRFRNRMYFPPVMHVRAENQHHRPLLQVYRHGVKAPLLQCLSLTLTDRVQHMDLSSINPDNIQIEFTMGWGLDGSGEHSNYHQLTKVSYTTKQVVSVCFAIREVTVSDGTGGSVTWSSTLAGANRPQNTRPLAIFPSKESKELLQEFVPIVDAEVKKLETEGVKVEVRGAEVMTGCEKCLRWMVRW